MYTVHTRLFQLCVERDLWDARERFRYRAPALGLFGRLLKPRLIEARHPPLHLELHLGDLGCPVHHFQGARGGGLHPGHGLPGFFEAGRQGHAEGGGVRRGNQLFGVRAFLPLEPSRERVRTVERAAAGLEVPLPFLELAFPDRHRLTRGHRPTPLKVRVGNLAEPLRGRYAWDARRLRLRGQPTMATKNAKKKKARRPARNRPALHPQRQQPESLRLRSMAASFTVNDLDRSVAWYRDVLGFVVGERWQEEAMVRGIQMKAGSCDIMLGQDDFAKGRDRRKGDVFRRSRPFAKSSWPSMMSQLPAFIWIPRTIASSCHRSPTTKPSTSRYQATLRSRSFTVNDAAMERSRSDSGCCRWGWSAGRFRAGRRAFFFFAFFVAIVGCPLSRRRRASQA